MQKNNAESEIKELIRRNGEDTDSFAKSKNEFIETINVLGKALEALGAAFLQEGKSSSKTSFLQATESSKQMRETLALVQEMTGKSVGEGNMGQASGFLSQLKEETAMNLQSATRAYLDGKAAFQQGMMAQQQMVAIQNAVIAAYEKEKAEALKAKGNMMKEYVATKKKMDGDVKFFEALKAEAADKHTKFSTLTADTEAQISACTEAITVLKGHLKSGFFFTQFSSEQTRFKESVSQLTSVVSKMSKHPRQELITAFLGVRSGSNTAADKIKSLCTGLITQLESEIAAVQQAKLDCANKEALIKSEITEAQRNIDEQHNISEAKRVAKENMENQQEETGKAIKALAVTLRNLNQQCSYEQTQLAADIATNTEDGKVLDLAISKLEAAFGESAEKLKDEVKDVKDAANSNDFNEYESGKANQDDRELKVQGAGGRQTAGAMVVKLLFQIKQSTTKALAEMNKDLTDSKAFCTAENAQIGTVSDAPGAETNFGELFAKYENEGAEITSLADDMQTALNSKSSFETEKDNKITELNGHGVGMPPNCEPNKFDSIVQAKRGDIEGLQTVIRYMNSIGGSSALAVQA